MKDSRVRARYHTLGTVTLVITLLVILWGAFVRLSGSGDGCGTNWPLCKGVIFPASEGFETYVEFAHRFTSGISFLLVCALFFYARKIFVRKHPARIAAGWALIFMVLEAGLGAVLVLFGWVDDNLSVGRSISLSLHLVNTFFLVSSLALTLWYCGENREHSTPIHSADRTIVISGFVLFCGTGILGVLAALSTTFFPAESLYHGITQDFSPQAELLVRLRIFHPFFAMISAGFLWWICSRVEKSEPEPAMIRVLHYLRMTIVLQVLLGASALIQKELLIIKLAHLLLADILAMLYAIVTWEVLRGQIPLRIESKETRVLKS